MISVYEILCAIIFKYVNFYDKHTIKKIRKFMNYVYITDLFDIEWKYKSKLSDDILLNYKFAVKLDAQCNLKITNVNHMIYLRVLNAGRNCGIDDEGIKNINPEKLYATDNPKISHINHMTKLKELHAEWCCGIDDEGIKNIKIKILYAHGNSKITRKNLFYKLIDNLMF